MPDAYDLAAAVIARLDQRAETLATAESLTGGLIGAALTSVPGASRVYRGGVISYASDLKALLAGVDVATLAAVGPVAAGCPQRAVVLWKRDSGTVFNSPGSEPM